MHGRVLSSDWRNPSIVSSFGITNGTDVRGVAKSGPDKTMYWEAQIYNKNTENISMVISHTPLPKALTDKLDEKGIKWLIK
jgi:hypothetical protein